jgi:hypothetical protein
MDYICSKCNAQIMHFPLGCEICGAYLCVQCSGDLVICDTCIDIQTVALFENDHVKCEMEGCNEWAVINQQCDSCDEKNIRPDEPEKPKKPLTKKERRQAKFSPPAPPAPKVENRKCPNMMKFCPKHILTCSCKRNICESCFKQGGCWQEGEACGFCGSIYGPGRMSTCESCQKKCCKYCASTKMDSNYHGHGHSLCIEHQLACKTIVTHTNGKNAPCGRGMYKLDIFKCCMPWCKEYACTRGIFQSIIRKEPIYACHKHIEFCRLCNYSFPIVNQRMIKFRNSNLIFCCSNCYKNMQSRIDLLLLAVKREHINMPKDVMSIIVWNICAYVALE